jgi:hypothetical protein
MLKTQPNVPGFAINRQAVIIVARILPGKAEAWRRFMQEMLGSRRQEYEASRQRLGIQAEQAWISETKRQTTGVIFIEAENQEQLSLVLATSDHPFDCWFREQLLTLQGLDLTRSDATLLPDLILSWRSDERRG